MFALTRRQAVLAFGLAGVFPALPARGAEGADDTAEVAASLRAGGMDLGGRSVRISALTIAPDARLRNGALHRGGGSAALISMPGSTGLQTIRAPVLENLQLFGYSGTVRTGTGMLIGSHAAFRCRDIGLQGFVTGYRHDGAQFGVLDNVKAYDNDVGFYLVNLAGAGGNNSNDYRGLQAAQNKVGVIVDGTRFVPNHSNNFYNPQVLGNRLCGMAFFGGRHVGGALATIYGYANEANASSPEESWTYQGLTIRRSSIYCRSFHLTIVSGFCAEATADPNILLEAGSRLDVMGLAGYGLVGGRCIAGDASSSCTITGTWDCDGSVNCLESFSGSLGESTQGGVLAGPIPTVDNPGLRNDLPAPQLITGNAVPLAGAAVATVRDARGAAVAVRCAARDTSGVAFGGVPYGGGGRLFVAFEIEADVDCRVSVRIFPNLGATEFDLFAGRRTRVAHWTNELKQAGPQALVVYKRGPTTPTLKLRRGHALSGDPHDIAFRAVCDRIIAGGYNPRT